MTTEARMNEPRPIRGRWTLVGMAPEYEGGPIRRAVLDGHLEPGQKIEVVPVPDEQAIERAAKYLCTVSFSSLPDCGGDRKDIARAVLAAALEPPESPDQGSTASIGDPHGEVPTEAQ